MNHYRLDYSEIDLRVGLEIHQQLDTKTKLFCSCPTLLSEDPLKNSVIIERRLRVGKSELGEIDPAALFEYRRGRVFRYVAPRDNTCLVELDEEPPHDVNREALVISLAIAMALNSTIVDEVYFMRKIVVDGSNTSGFQRTAIIALGGFVESSQGRVRIQTIALEEDSARKLSEENGVVTYALDRLGIPLIEISTAPDIRSPEQAEEVAYRIGMLMRLTGKVKRGLGTIRQDLNISIKGGAKIEIKGVQRLELISKIVELEAYRQYRLLQLKEEIMRRGLSEELISEESIKDLTEVVSKYKNKLARFIRETLDKDGRVFTLPLKGFRGLLGFELGPNRRFGTELADYARAWGGVGGLIHSDELPRYGIDEEIIKKIYDTLSLNKDSDAFIIIIDQRNKALKAFDAVIKRIKQAFRGVPEETRAANEDGTTRYMRPQPGAARMYPETDILPIRVTKELIDEAAKYVPEPFDVKLKRFIEDHKISRDLAEALIRSRYLALYEELVNKLKDKVSPQLIASTLINTLKALSSEGLDTSVIEEKDLIDIFTELAQNRFSKEFIPDILREKIKDPKKSIGDIVSSLDIRILSLEELDLLIDKIIGENKEEIIKRGERAFSFIMGKVMDQVRGKIDGKIVAERVKDRLKNLLI
ncbi:MAG: Glu-tRNA(Gln) amidotransferase subunit GatE [Sulfolobales archaeon]